MTYRILKIEDLFVRSGEALPSTKGWQLRAVLSDECLSYIAWNSETLEALAVDPKEDDWDAYEEIIKPLDGYLWLGVIDTHTHADHISCAARLAEKLVAPLIMHSESPSKRVSLRVSRETVLASRSAPLKLFLTPGHTPDSLTAAWGPFLFGGDTFLYGDTGRDDLPGGDVEAHFESVQLIKERAKPELILLPGHDHKGGRASLWKTQLELNTSLKQTHDDFVKEAGAFDAPAPKLLKKSLALNVR